MRGRLRRWFLGWLWGWGAIAQLVTGLLLSTVYLSIATFGLVGVLTLPAMLMGVPLLALVLPTAFGIGHLERWRLQALTGLTVRPAPRPAHPQTLWRLVLDPRPWRALLHLSLIAVWGLLAGGIVGLLTSVAIALLGIPVYVTALPGQALALPWGGFVTGAGRLSLAVLLGVTGLILLPWVARCLVLVDAALARWLLGGGHQEELERLSERVQTLTHTREAAVDSVEVERRRIERDLHDGPQQRLVAIAMDLGMARQRLERDPAGAGELLDRAHTTAKEAIIELRQVTRGIHPPVLTHRGLDAALSALAARSPVPVSVRVDLPARPSPTIEAIAYFCVSEALTNVAKHSRARSARVDVTQKDGRLVLEVRDDGVGGADPSAGSGLPGLRDRVAAVDGTLRVTSPPGGPTLLAVELPTSSGSLA